MSRMAESIEKKVYAVRAQKSIEYFVRAKSRREAADQVLWMLMERDKDDNYVWTISSIEEIRGGHDG